MPGIFGLFQTQPADSFERRFRAMGERMRHHSWYSESTHIDGVGGVALGRLGLGTAVSGSDFLPEGAEEWIGVLDGELFDADSLRGELSRRGCRFQGDTHAEILIRGYQHAGPKFLASLPGNFAGAIWDRREGRLHLVNDRFGLKPLYYATTTNGLVFGSELKSLLVVPGVSRARNARGIIQFFTYGQLLNQDTLYRDIRVLPAGSCLEYDLQEAQLRLESYGTPRLGISLASEAETLDRFDQAFGRAMDRCIAGAGHLGLSLSGGMDSRTILGAIDTRANPVTTVSLGMPGSIDTLSAEAMARVSGCDHHRYQLDSSFLQDFEQHLERMVMLTDGHYLCQCIVMPTLPIYRELGMDVLLRGHAGELLHMDKAYNYSMDRDGWNLSDGAAIREWLGRRFRAYMVEAVDGPLFCGSLEQERDSLARESLDEALAASEAVDPPLHRIWHLFLTQRLRRETGLSLMEFNSVVATRLPFLDPEVIDLVFQTPPEIKKGEAIQAAILSRRNPAFLRIPNANTGTRVGAGSLARSASRFRMRVLAKLGVPGYQPYERLGLWLRRELRPVVERILLSDSCRDRGLFDPQTVARVVRQHNEGEKNHTFLLMALMIFEKGQQLLNDELSSEMSPMEAAGTTKVL